MLILCSTCKCYFEYSGGKTILSYYPIPVSYYPIPQETVVNDDL